MDDTLLARVKKIAAACRQNTSYNLFSVLGIETKEVLICRFRRFSESGEKTGTAFRDGRVCDTDETAGAEISSGTGAEHRLVWI